MLFNSYEFILVFLPIVVVVYFLFARASHLLAAVWLCAASLFFYGWWNPKFVALLVGSIAFNYAAGYAIGSARSNGNSVAKPLLIAALAANLALLGYFKYANFFISTVGTVTGEKFTILDIVLPLGISFFTFTQISFLVDVYRGIAAGYNVIHYTLFVSYFPHLIAGPVLHHQQLVPQFGIARTYAPHGGDIAMGLTMFTIGLAKKVLIADSLAGYAVPLFTMVNNGLELRLISAWSGALAYTFQLYFDFSGYSDMAIGLSLLFGVRLPVNFNSPYKARNIIEFWRRWHMTLANFLRDYLYFPLGGNRRGPWRRYINLMITMLLGGLWHGASWTFVVWGGLHGIYLMVNHAWHGSKKRIDVPLAATRFGTVVASAITFIAVVIGWVFFRAETLGGAMIFLRGMTGFAGFTPDEFADAQLGPLLPFAILIVFCGTIAFLCPNSQEISAVLMRRRPSLAVGFACGIVGAMCLITLRSVHSEFLYFQF
jgi:alginate O-acetyltransferase complex protein AlgI